MHTPAPFIALLSLIIGISFLLAIKKQKKKSDKTYSYQQQNVLTENEQAMFWKLIKALPNHVVLAQVSVDSVIRGKDFASHKTISQSSFDFVICTKDFKAIAAIEIDDKTHQRADRQKSDATKNNACTKAGVKLIRWKSHQHPTDQEILTALNQT